MKRPLWLMLTLACLGCGLSEYEQRMREAQAEWDRISEEHSKLGDPVQIPETLADDMQTEDNTAEPFDLFFRAPRELSTQATSQHPLRDATVYHYPRTPSTAKSPSPVLEMYLAATRNRKDVTREDFMKGVLEHFPRGQGDVVKDTKKYKRSDGTELEYTFQSFVSSANENVRYSVFFYENDAFRVAVVFLIQGDQLMVLPKPVELSLGTLAVAPDAGSARARYQADEERLRK